MPDERRNDYRRTNDIIDVSEVRLLRQELSTLQQKIFDEEAEDKRRLDSLEIEIAEFRRKFNVGKGFFYGIICVLGAAGVFVVDSVKELMALMK